MRHLGILLRIAVLASLAMRWMSASIPGQAPRFATAVRTHSSAPRWDPESIPLVVEPGKCFTTILDDDQPICIYDPEANETLNLWVEHPLVNDLQIEIDDEPWTSYGKSRIVGESGARLEIELPQMPARQLTLSVSDSNRWPLRLGIPSQLPFEQLAALARLDPGSLFQLENDILSGNLERLPEMSHLIDRSMQAGLLHDAVVLSLITAHHLSAAPGAPELALEFLDRLPPLPHYPWGQAAVSTYRANALLELGRLSEAAIAYRIGARHAIRFDDENLKIDALAPYAQVLVALGYFEAAFHWSMEAIHTIEDRDEPMDVPLEVAIRTSVGWTNLRLREAGRLHHDPEHQFRRALELAQEVLAKDPSDDVGELDPARLGLAKLALIDGSPSLALERLDEVELRPLTPSQIVDVHDIRLRARLAAHDPAVRDALAELQAAAARATSPEGAWRAVLDEGLVLEAEGDLDGAEAAYRRAEAELDTVLPLAHLGAAGQGPSWFRESSDALLSVLLTRGQHDEALCVARQTRARTATLALSLGRMDPERRDALDEQIGDYLAQRRQLERLQSADTGLTVPQHATFKYEVALQRDEIEELARTTIAEYLPHRGRPPCDELRARQPGELLMALVPRGDDLLVFLHDDHGTTVKTSYALLRDLDPEALLRSWSLDWLDEELRRATRIRVLASGRAAKVPIHALSWQGRPLVTQLPVVYGFELPEIPRPRPTGSRVALVLADDAAGAEEERALVMQELEDAGWTMPTDEMPALERVTLFHYAGHNMDEDDDRRWAPNPIEASHISLPDGGHLSAADVLMMDAAPQTVVLMACKTGIHDDRMARSGLGLGPAFLGAGSQAVVATTDEVLGSEALSMSEALYTASDPSGSRDAGAWMMHGAQQLYDRGFPAETLLPYRVLVP